jgi:hypothetical protein
MRDQRRARRRPNRSEKRIPVAGWERAVQGVPAIKLSHGGLGGLSLAGEPYLDRQTAHGDQVSSIG